MSMTAIACASAPAAPAARRWRPLGVALAAALGACAAMSVASGFGHGFSMLPPCGFKYVTSLPCPGCGGTRALAALAVGDAHGALALNPAVAFGALIALGSVPLTAMDLWVNRGRLTARVAKWSRRRAFSWTLGAIAALNWIYLLIVGR